MLIRPITTIDLPFLHRMLLEAVYWRPDAVHPTLDDFLRDPQFDKLLKAWGRRGDAAVVAEEAGEKIGAAWFRFWSDYDHSYGYVSQDIPELGVAVACAHRSRGTGRRLLQALIDEATAREIRAISLSVDPANYARRLYESLGFKKVGESGTSWTYQLDLS